MVSGDAGTLMTSEGIRVVDTDGIPDMVLAVVCDGLGGLIDGDVASRETCDLLMGWASTADLTDDAVRSLTDGLRSVESEIMRDVRGGGTTASMVLGIDGLWTSVHIGDSRCYAVLPDTVWRTADQSPVEDMFRRGEITEEEMNGHPLSNVMDWCIGNGGSRHSVVDRVPEGWGRIVLCSDGAFGYMPPEDFRVLARSAGSAVAIAEESYARGSTDNITVLSISRHTDGGRSGSRAR